jgi:zinc transport system ATP-binding protein
MKKILEVKDLSVEIGKEIILSDIQFTVNEQDVVVILGPNGAGKSTLMRALLGLVTYKGNIIWYSKDIAYLPPQESILRTNLPPLTIKDFFSFKNIEEENAKRMIEKVGLSKNMLLQQFATLSTGQFQRMMLAWILIDSPKILLLDEPTAGIDIGGEESIYSLLHTLWKEQGLTILLITHNVNIIWKHATNVLCLNKKLICYGSPEKTLSPELLKKVYGTEVALYEHRHS